MLLDFTHIKDNDETQTSTSQNVVDQSVQTETSDLNKSSRGPKRTQSSSLENKDVGDISHEKGPPKKKLKMGSVQKKQYVRPDTQARIDTIVTPEDMFSSDNAPEAIVGTHVESISCEDLTEETPQKNISGLKSMNRSKTGAVNPINTDKTSETTQEKTQEPFEVLDLSGYPGPKRSRMSKRDLFDGIVFYCMPPCGVLNAELLSGMLEASGGKVGDIDELKATYGGPPALLLAKPAIHSKEEKDTFSELATLSVVPVNIEWAIKCLGSYSLCKINDLLLCPKSMVADAIRQWPIKLRRRLIRPFDNE